MTARRSDREGMALLTVLLLVAVMSVVAVAVLDDVRFSIRRASNSDIQDRAQDFASGAEALAQVQIERLVGQQDGRTAIRPEWNGRPVTFPVDGGLVTAVLRDGQGCFNLNSVVEGQGEDLMARPQGVEQFVALGRAVGLPESKMRTIADSLVDWLDADPAPRPLGAEDGAYAGLAVPYRTGGVLLAEVTELRAVRGVDSATYARLRPFVCALPTARLTPLNANTLTVDQAPLLMSLGPISLQTARAVIQARPADGWSSGDAFWNQPLLRTAPVPADAREAVGVTTRFFSLRIDVRIGDFEAVRTALIQVAPTGAAHTVIQRWTPDE